jgi:hypothetical protein
MTFTTTTKPRIIVILKEEEVEIISQPIAKE